jgi:uncharacterized protein (DUF1786 family)
VRPEQATLLLGSGEVLADFVNAGWIAPVISEHRLVLYGYRHLEECVRRLESGEWPEAAIDAQGKQVQTRSSRMPRLESIAPTGSFHEQARGVVTVKPFLLRPDEAAIFVGSIALLEEFRKAGWIKALYEQHRLVLFSVRHLEACVARIEVGELPGAYANSDAPRHVPVAKPQTTAVISPMFMRKARRTRRPMPVAA